MFLGHEKGQFTGVFCCYVLCLFVAAVVRRDASRESTIRPFSTNAHVVTRKISRRSNTVKGSATSSYSSNLRIIAAVESDATGAPIR